MKCFKLVNSGVIKLVPVNRERDLNDLYRQGFKCILKNGVPEVIEMNTPKKLNFISDPVVREAIEKLSDTETVKTNDVTPAQITKDVAKAYEKTEDTK